MLSTPTPTPVHIRWSIATGREDGHWQKQNPSCTNGFGRRQEKAAKNQEVTISQGRWIDRENPGRSGRRTKSAREIRPLQNTTETPGCAGSPMSPQTARPLLCLPSLRYKRKSEWRGAGPARGSPLPPPVLAMKGKGLGVGREASRC